MGKKNTFVVEIGMTLFMDKLPVIVISSLAETAYRDYVGVIPCFSGELRSQDNIVERRDLFIKHTIKKSSDVCIVIKAVPNICIVCGDFKEFSDDHFCYDCHGYEMVFSEEGIVYNDMMTRVLLCNPYKNNYCVGCYNEGDDTLFTCESCQSVKYCSISCSLKHWASHQPRCKVITQKRLAFMANNNADVDSVSTMTTINTEEPIENV